MVLKGKILTEIDQRRGELVRLLQNLVRIPSESSDVNGDEYECQMFIAEYLKRIDLDVDVFTPVEVKGVKGHPIYDSRKCYENRPNVVGVWHGKEKGPRLLLAAHADVVSPGDVSRWLYGPWSGVVADGKVYGRGAQDDKSGIAVMLFVSKLLRESGFEPKGDFYLASIVGEEQAGREGALAVAKRGYRAEGGIYLDGCYFKIGIGNLGGGRFSVKVTSDTNNFLYTWTLAHKLIDIMRSYSEGRREVMNVHPLYFDDPFKEPCTLRTCHINYLPNLLEGQVQLEGSLAVFPGEDNRQVQTSLERTLKKSLGSCQLEFTTPYVWLEPSRISMNEPIVKILAAAYEEVAGVSAKIRGQYRSDMYVFNNYGGTPTVSFGVGELVGEGAAHKIDECISIADLVKYTKVVAHAIQLWGSSLVM